MLNFHLYWTTKVLNVLKKSAKRGNLLSLSTLSSSSSSSPFAFQNSISHLSQQTRSKRREFANLLQLSASENSVLYYKKLHCQILISGFETDTFLSNILLNVYSKSQVFDDARTLFDRMPERNLITWSTLVSMYSRHGFYEKAVFVFVEFRKSHYGSPNEYILASVISACTQLGADSRGCLAVQVHSFVAKSGFDRDVYVGTTLVDFYSKNVSIDEARLVFDGLSEKTAVTWTTIITGYVKSGRSAVSLQLFRNMIETDVPDRYVLSSVLSGCSNLEFVEGGKQIHAHVLRRGADIDVSVTNVLIDCYVKCGRVKTAEKLFCRMVDKNVISWTTIIAGYMQNSFHKEAMRLFVQMSRLGFDPDGFACTSVLTSCGSLEALEKGKQVHAYTIKAKLESDVFVRNGLIDMYAKCDSLTDARRIFDRMADHNLVSYNTMIEGYSRQENLTESLNLFQDMRLRLIQPSILTFVSLLGVSALLFTLDVSRQIHSLMFKYGVSLEVFAGSALIDVYSKCSCINEARLVFDEMNEKDIVVWNTMFSGYTQQSENEEALKLYLKLQLSDEKPNEFTFAALVTAASNLASFKHGQQFHSQLEKTGLEFDPFVINALVDMYAKCGSCEEALKSFNATTLRDVVCWNSIITTLANHGKAEKALEMFERMKNENVKPNYISFIGVLSACSHAGFVEAGLYHFKSMSRFNIQPRTEHYACMVSLLGRAGKLNEAKDFIEKMPIKAEAIVWRSLLSACTVAGNVEMGKLAAEAAISIDPTDSGSYILLSNIFAGKGMWLDVKKVRQRMDCDHVVKEPGHSWIEVNNEVHVFVARDRTHSAADLIYSALYDLILQIKGFGYERDMLCLQAND